MVLAAVEVAPPRAILSPAQVVVTVEVNAPAPAADNEATDATTVALADNAPEFWIRTPLAVTVAATVAENGT